VRRRIWFSLASIAALVGALVGYLASSEAATNTVDLYFQPPAASAGYAKLTCGWHSNCLQGTYGNGLDFVDQSDPQTDLKVYARLTAYEDRLDTNVDARILVEEITSETCYSVKGKVYAVGLAKVVAEMRYYHTRYPAFNSWGVEGDDLGKYWSKQISTMVYPDKSSACSNGYHVHEEHANISHSFVMRDNGPSGCPTTGKYYPCLPGTKSDLTPSSVTTWTRRIQWSY
jgi:hypothetical protein